MYDYVLEFFSQGTSAYGGIVLILVLTGAGLPIPEEIPVIAAGVLSGHGTLHVGLAFAACLVGALCGDCVMYGLGRYFGRSLLRERHWFAPYLTPEREALIEEHIKRHGLKVFFLARFLVGLRSPVFLAAGILRVPFRRFILIDLFCATVVISFFFSLGYIFANQIRAWLQAIRQAEYALSGSLLAVIAIAGLYFYVRRRRARAEALNLGAAGSDLPNPASEQSKSVA
jgi:membrane protein DedA with SNARE-associated domain